MRERFCRVLLSGTLILGGGAVAGCEGFQPNGAKSPAACVFDMSQDRNLGLSAYAKDVLRQVNENIIRCGIGERKDSSLILSARTQYENGNTFKKLSVEFSKTDPDAITAIEMGTVESDTDSIKSQRRSRLIFQTNSQVTLLTQVTTRVNDHFFQSTKVYSTDTKKHTTEEFPLDRDLINAGDSSKPVEAIQINPSSPDDPVYPLEMDRIFEFVEKGNGIIEWVKTVSSQTFSQNRRSGNSFS